MADQNPRKNRKRLYLTAPCNPSIPKSSRRRWLETEVLPHEGTGSGTYSDTQDTAETECYEERNQNIVTTTTTLGRNNTDDYDERSSTSSASTIDANIHIDHIGQGQIDTTEVFIPEPDNVDRNEENMESFGEHYFFQDMETDQNMDMMEQDMDNFARDEDTGDFPDEEDIPCADEFIGNSSDVTKGQAIVTLIAFILRHHLSSAAVSDMLEMFDILFPGVFPKSIYLLNKGFVTEDYYDAHIYCPLCDVYLGRFSKCERLSRCNSCNGNIDREKCLKNGHFFLYIPVENQLRQLLKRFTLIKKSDFTQSDYLSGAFSGRIVKDLYNRGKISDKDITLLWNCDGAPVFRSSKRSVWPLQACVNEIASDSKDNCLLIGLWFSAQKPWSHCYLKPFIDEMKHLGNVGMNWINNDNEDIHSKVYCLCSSCDSCARPMFRNTTQFNGRFGCDWCLHEGEVIERGDGTSRIYPPLLDNSEKRTFKRFSQDALRSSDSTPVNGVRGVSPLLFLPMFDIVRGFVPDYLHCVLLGVVRMFVGLWFDSKNHQKPWYIGQKTNDVSHRLVSMKPPSEISRLPRALSERKFWKGSEWKSFLIYYSLIALHGTLPRQFLNHWFLLVYSINILLQDRINLSDVDLVERVLHNFVRDVPNLYGREYCTFNVHQLLHLSDAVRDWGPLWVFSCFRFEGNIGQILSLVRGTNCVPMQICKTFLLRTHLPKLYAKHFTVCDMHLNSYFNKLMCSGTYVRKKSVTVENVHLYGSFKTKELNPAESLALSRFYGEDPKILMCKVYDRFSVKSMYFSCLHYKPSNRHGDDTIQLENGMVCVILQCIVGNFMCHCIGECVGSCEKVLLLLNSIEKASDCQLACNKNINISCDKFLTVGIQNPITLCMEPSMILRKCFRFQKNDKHYVIPLPTSQELDK